MASKKKHSEGIALLSMYNDEEDEDMEDLEGEEQEEVEEEEQQFENTEREEREQDDDYRDSSRMAEEDDYSISITSDRVIGGDDSANDYTPPIADQNTTLQQPRLSAAVSPRQEAVPTALSSRSSSRRGTLTIVDYGLDEVAMSPEPEEGEIEGSGRVMYGVELQTANGDFQDKTPPGTVQVLTSSNQVISPSSDEPSQFDTMNHDLLDSKGAEVEEAIIDEEKEVDPLDKFLPPPPKVKCSEELQRKINKFLELKKAGKSFNAEVRNRKDYRNPDFLLRAVRYQDIDEIGSCFSKDVFDPHGYDKSDYYLEIEADMRREDEKKKSQKMEFVSAGAQPGTVAAAPKVNMPIPGVSTVAVGALHSVPPIADNTNRDSRPNKKSKWDKVDGDRRNPLPSGGQDSIAAVGAHAALLSAASAGAGYTAFAQQRRREAEEKRSSERKVERRS